MADRLTERELEVVRAYLRHRTQYQAAIELDIQPQTFKNHVQSIYRKTGARNMAQVVWLLRHRLDP